ncbi:unnamed protein product [Lactuca saligna]|uniref:PPC domain-containing protein n=1 Tax=Lactuca saligna TaxID=75948 RepID=A0AA35ZGU0_LACSI|nr:unnamed protein product [Lactuca saligna]
MFSDLRHQPPPTPAHFAVTHHLVSTSEEADSKKESNTTNDDASIEVVRRPRGRPPGSKNKPKPPVFVTREPDTAMSPYVLEISDGSDIVAAITQLCNHRTTGLCVLSGSGTVANVSFQQPTTTTTAITFHGRFNLLSISATILPSSVTTGSFGGSEGITDILSRLPATRFSVSLAGPQGQTIGGTVSGPLIAAGTVYIIAASFNSPLYHRLPMEEDDHVRSSGGGTASAAREQSPSGGGDSGRHHAEPSSAVDSLSMYGCHLPSEGIWTPTPRQASRHSPLF